MTIIQPHQIDYKMNFLISTAIFLLVASAVWGVFLYNQLVNFSHEIAGQEKIIERAEVESAELKNILYQMIDSKNSESLISSRSLISEKSPDYLKQQEMAAR